MIRRECDRAWQIDALRDSALGPRDVRSFQRHRRVCTPCAERMADDAKLRELGRAMHVDGASELELRRLRARVLRHVATADATTDARTSLQSARLAVIALAIALCGGLFAVRMVSRRHTAATPAPFLVASAAAPNRAQAFAATVTPGPGARWEQARAANLERVVLVDGSIRVHVRQLQAGDRFVVDLPDGELEVRGTTFDVSVHDGATSDVHVDEGSVEVRLVGRPTRRLVASDTWRASAPAIESTGVEGPSTQTPTPRNLAASALTTSAAPLSHANARPPDVDRSAAADDGTAQYAEAIALLRARRYEAAADAFHAFATAHARASQAEDASFLEALALARAGRLDAAAVIAERHLVSFPKSFHRSDAGLLIARAASARGDCETARSVLRTWFGPSAAMNERAVLGDCSR